MKGKIALIALLVVLLIAPAMGAKIVKFDGEDASAADQVDYLVLGYMQSGNVTVKFTDVYNVTSLLVFKLAAPTEDNANVSLISYSVSGDTANLTVSLTKTKLTFNYTGSSYVLITNVTLTFDYAPYTDEGIDTAVSMTEPATLVYVSKYNSNVYSASNTTEKITYIVLNPFNAFSYSGTFKAPDCGVSDSVSGGVKLDLSECDSNDLLVTYEFTRNLNQTIAPISKAYINLGFSKTYFTDISVAATSNAIDMGYSISTLMTTNKFRIINVSKDTTVQLSMKGWDTNGTAINAHSVGMTIDPIGGKLFSYSVSYNVNITTAAAAAAPVTPYFWWEYEIAGYSILVWLLVIFIVSLIVLIAYRKSKGLPILPRSAGGLGSAVALLLFLTILEQISQYATQLYEWVKDNYILVGAILAAVFVFIYVFFVHKFTRD